MILEISSEFDRFYCRGFGPNCENTNIKMIISLPVSSFNSDDFTAKIKLLALPVIETKFSMNATASKYLQTNLFA